MMTKTAVLQFLDRRPYMSFMLAIGFVLAIGAVGFLIQGPRYHQPLSVATDAVQLAASLDDDALPMLLAIVPPRADVVSASLTARDDFDYVALVTVRTSTGSTETIEVYLEPANRGWRSGVGWRIVNAERHNPSTASISTNPTPPPTT